MILRLVLGASLLFGATSSIAAPPPPPPPELPRRIPHELQGSEGACPKQSQPEPAPLDSARFNWPVDGDTILFSAAPSFQQIRYVARVIRRPSARTAWARLVRLKRRADCNVLDRTGAWDFELSIDETASLFQAVADFGRRSPGPEVTLDGTQVQVQRHSSGKTVFDYSSNDPAKDELSGAVLGIMRKHVPAGDLPSASDW